MEFFTELWKPILLSAALVFIWSAVAWTVLPFHNREWKGLPGAEAVRDAVRSAGFAPGQYMFPWMDDPKARRSPEFAAKLAEGPSGMVTLMKPGPMRMGAMMTQSLLWNLAVSFLTAYAAWHAFPIGAAPSYGTVYRVVAMIAMLTYAFGTMGQSIWFGRPWKSWFIAALDAVVFALLMGGSFAGLWPGR